jgi:hypothetical protein
MAGILGNSSRLNALFVRYEVSYNSTNWGAMKTPSGEFIRQDEMPGEHMRAVRNTGADLFSLSPGLRFMAQGDAMSGFTMPRVTWDGQVLKQLLSRPDNPKYRPEIRITSSSLAERPPQEYLITMMEPMVITGIAGWPWKSIQETGGIAVAGTETVEGRMCIVLTGHAGADPHRTYFPLGYPFRAWIDCARGFSVVRLDLRTLRDTADQFRSYAVTEMRELEGGIWIPVAIRFENGKNILVRDVRINDAVTSADFELPIPSGTRISDKIANVTYVFEDHQMSGGAVSTMPDLSQERTLNDIRTEARALASNSNRVASTGSPPPSARRLWPWVLCCCAIALTMIVFGIYLVRAYLRK